MGNNTFLQEKSNLHRNKTKGINYTVVNATYIKEYTLLVSFKDGTVKEIDFAPALEKYALGYYDKYKKIENFKRFKIENGNIVWGKDWDLIFPPKSVYKNKF